MKIRATLLSVTTCLVVCHAAEGSDKPLEYATLPTYLQTLNFASAFNGRNTGAAFSQSEEFKAYEIAGTKGAAIKDELQYLLRVATPAGRLYSALLLRKIDKQAGDAALKNLLENNEDVKYGLWGCKYSVVPTSTVARDLLRDGDSIMRFFDKKANGRKNKMVGSKR